MSTRNFHVPLSEELHAMLHAEAARRGRAGTQLVREILEQQLKLMQSDSLDQEIAAYARMMAQTPHDSPVTDGSAHLWELLKDDEW
ncbi:hypothetical protein IV102_36855 [bacterium]|nr:hypothetical protein [bacterium]